MRMGSNNHTAGNPSFVERLDPRVKFITLLVLALQIYAVPSETSLLVVCVVLASAIASSRIPLLFLLKRLSSVLVFVVLIIALHTFTASGEVLFQFMGMFATREGLIEGLVLSARIILLLVAATLFVRTTSIPAMIDAIETTLRPVRRRFGAVIQVLTIALNFVPMFIRSAQQIKMAQIARGAEPDKNIVRQVHFAFSAVVPLFAMSARSSEHLAVAMESRSYNPLNERTQYSKLRAKPQDLLTLFFIAFQFVLVAMFN